MPEELVRPESERGFGNVSHPFLSLPGNQMGHPTHCPTHCPSRKSGLEMVLPSGGVWKLGCNLDLSGQFQSFWEPLSGIQIMLD